MAVNIFTQDNFDTEVLQSDLPVLVDFWAGWCGPCRILSPVVEQLAEEVTDVKIGKLDIDANQDLAEQYGVMSIPTLILFDHGLEVKRSVGVVPRGSILEMIGH